MKFSRAIRHLNMKDVNRKQLQKEKALKEGMNTSNIYPEVSEVPNQDLSNFEAIMTGGERLGFSGADGNTAGNASFGDVSGVSGVALSPPHPVTGVRTSAAHVRDGVGSTTPLRPGVTISRGFSDNPPQYTMGSCLWFYDSDFNNGAGQPAGKWCNLEFSNFDGDTNGKWFFWDTIKPPSTLAGLYIANTDLSQHPCGDISDLIDGLNFPGIGGSLGAAKIPVLTVKGLETEPIYPGPIAQLFGLGQRALESLLDLMNRVTRPLTNPFQSIGMPYQIATSVGKNEPEMQPEPSNAEKQEFFDGIDPNLIFNNDESNINPKNNQPYVTKGIPINDEKQPYSDENFYVDPITGRVTEHTEESRNKYPPNTINQDPTKHSTLGARGESFGQIYKNKDGVWVYSFEDHAYHNLNSSDVGETEGGAGAISNKIHMDADKAHGRNQGGDGPDNTSPNTGGMSGYPCNSSACIRGDSIIKFEIPVSEIRNVEVRNAINSKIEERNKSNSKNESYISESAKLGHFEPDILDVDINDIRKGIMPEYPKQPPAEMIDGYHQKSPLRPKPLDNEPYVKITKVDLIRNHRIKPSEVDEMMDTINRLNDYIKKHPEDLIYVQQRYPKDDPRLAELNWKMDQMLNASEDYLEKNFKENKKLFNRAIDRTKNNIKLTDPKYAQQRYDELRGTVKPKKTNLVGRLGKHLNKYESKGVLRHVDSDDFKKISERKLEKKRFLEKQEQKRLDYINDINAEMDEFRSDWRKDISESDFTNITKGNRIGQTFQHASGATITIDNTMSDPSDQPSQVTLDLGFGEKITVDAPSGNEYGIAGITSHLGASGGGVKELDKKVMQKQNVKTAGEINQQLDASEKASGAESARVEGEKPNFVFGVDDPTKPGVMTHPEEIKMNERLYKFQKIYTDTVEKNTKIRDDHERTVISPYVNKLLSPLKLRTPGTSKKLILYKERQISSEDGKIYITLETNDKKTIFKKYRLTNRGYVLSSEKSFDQPRLRSLPTMPKFLQDWQSQSIDPSFAIQRSEGEKLAKVGKVESAFNLVNYYIDNHVKTGAGMDPSRKNIRHDVTNLYTEKSKDWLKTNTDDIKFIIDDMIKRGSSNEEISKRVDQLLVFKQPRDISNSIGNAMGFDVDYYKQTGNYAYNSTYKFTSTYDMGIRGKLSFLSGAAQKYVSGQLDGETAMAVQNPMQFRVEIESGKKDTQNVKGTGVKNNAVSGGATTKTLQGIKKPSTKTIQGIKKLSKSKFDGFDRGDLSFKRKKKKDK